MQSVASQQNINEIRAEKTTLTSTSCEITRKTFFQIYQLGSNNSKIFFTLGTIPAPLSLKEKCNNGKTPLQIS